jgi:plasmid stabilization system protein ParE
MARRVPYKVVVSDRARQMLAGHIRFLAEKSPPAARKKKSEIMDAIRSLGTMPERFPFLSAEPLPPNKYHKMFTENWYLILYQIKDQTVYVDFVVDCRQDYGWLIKS